MEITTVTMPMETIPMHSLMIQASGLTPMETVMGIDQSYPTVISSLMIQPNGAIWTVMGTETTPTETMEISVLNFTASLQYRLLEAVLIQTMMEW